MQKSLQELQTATLSAFTRRPEVQQICLFGSLEHNQHDAYSDMDLHVVSSDFDTTMQDLPSIINSIGAPFVWYPFHPQPGNTGYAILFRDYPLYHRLDITLLDLVTPPIVAQGTCIYTNPRPPLSQPSTYQAPQLDAPLQKLYGYGIGAIRYAKYRKRGKALSAFKFYRAQCDAFFLKRYEKETHNAKTQIDLAVYQLLDQLPDNNLLQHYLYPTNEQAMDRLFVQLLEAMLSEEQKTLSSNHRGALTEIITFVRNELLLP
ncbi:hypothetical protein [Tengunoibacter tsumagoiensis]|uniref:Uncharacterized protein n=1 Tax=Tengunoibacter tsumagoiensis TaxID=2014871 RepID=A0A402A2Z2_9CHLR|nr:hypothetical protein [Tengunoibacter tsumagoiensis]GCE13504.1 hypothetical protein KTT_33630 [Tengunoibacter tsumagoiensis]